MGNTDGHQNIPLRDAPYLQACSGPSPAEAGKKFYHSSFFHVALIMALGLIVYSNTFHVPFQFDDAQYIVEDPFIKDITYFFDPSIAANVAKYYPTYNYDNFSNRYIGYLSFALNYLLHHLDVSGYHIVNLLVHILNAVLLYYFFLLSLRTPNLSIPYPFTPSNQTLLALFAALFFVAHPIQSEAVTYISQRFTALATMFYLLTMVLYAGWRLSSCKKEPEGIPKKRIFNKMSLLYAAAIFSTVLAMKTKEISFTIPLIITFYEFLFFGGPVKKRLLALLPFILTMSIIPVGIIKADADVGDFLIRMDHALQSRPELSRADYLLTEMRIVLTYLRLLVFPINQNIAYDYPVERLFFKASALVPFVFLSLLVILIFFLIFRVRRGSRCHPVPVLIGFGLIWFLVTLSVESSVIPLNDLIFEHRLYLPSIGFFMAATVLLADVTEGRRIKSYGVLCISIVLIYAAAAYTRNTVWESPKSLWEDAVSKAPLNERSRINLGLAYYDGGAINKATEHFQFALMLNPNSALAHLNLGMVYDAEHLPSKAIEHLEIACELDPQNPLPHNILGILYSKNTATTDKAIEHYEEALRLNPYYYEALFNLGVVFLEKNMNAQAKEKFEQVISINPDHKQALMFLNYLSNSR